MDQFRADPAALTEVRFSAAVTTEQLLEVASQWQQLSPASLETAFGMYGPQFLSAYGDAQESMVRASTTLASVSRGIDRVTDKAIGMFTADDAATSAAVEATL